jgi:hypothetical protein
LGDAFFADLAEMARPEGGFMAILEVCSMNCYHLSFIPMRVFPIHCAPKEADRKRKGHMVHASAGVNAWAREKIRIPTCRAK